MAPPLVSDLYAAQRRLLPWVTPTMLRESPWLSAAAGGRVLLKLECLNLTHSFKIRGAFNALLELVEQYPDPRHRPVVVTASAGNHGAAMACAAGRLGVRLVVFTPAGAPSTKREAIARHGAELRAQAPDYDAAEDAARAFATTSDGIFISAYNHAAVIAGAGTIGLEIADACPTVGSVIVSLGGGGLASGVGLALRAAAPAARVIGVEADASTPFTTGRARGAITTIEVKPTLADGLAGNLEPGSMTFPLVQQVVDEVVTVGEAAIAAAMRNLAAHEHLTVEGSAAVAVAALSTGRVADAAWPVVVVVSGSNVDVETFRSVLNE